MDSYEATRIVFSRIQNFDPENASKIMGLLLIQDHGEKEMIRLAFGPEALVHSVILKARKDLGLPSNSPSTPSTPSSPSVPFLSSNPISISRQNCSRLSLTIPNPSAAAWSPEDLISPSNISNFSSSSSSAAAAAASSASSSSSSSSTSAFSNSSLPFYQNGSGPDIMDDFHLQDQLSFLNDDHHQVQHLSSSPTNDNNSNGQAAAAGFPSYWPSSVHRRSCSVNDMCLASSEDPNSVFGWKPCLYFARGYCKNGTSCRFLHGGEAASDGVIGAAAVPPPPQVVVGSPNNKMEVMEQCHHELLRSKSAQQQRLVSASQLMAASANSFPYSPKCMNFLLQQQQNESQRAAAALMMGEDLHKFGRSRLERNDFAMNGVNPASRQIYLTFPADSTFREEDVSNYFSIYGPVQDVRIPYQQKRMFGFVTFVYPETVKLILAKGNPHFVCDARVLVKPYKEKGKVQDKYRKQQQPQVERGDFSPCGTPTGLDSRDPFDLQLGARMFYNSQDLLWRRKLEEQAELQQALELQSRRLMGLQLLDVKKHHQRALSTGSPVQSPTQSHNLFGQNLVLSSIYNSSELPVENCSPPTPSPADQQLQPPPVAAAPGRDLAAANGDENGNDKESPHDEVGDLLESLEHNLPDSPFASPTKAGGGDYHHMAAFSGHVMASEANNNGSDPSSATTTSTSTSSNMNLSASLLSSSGSSTLDMGSFKSFNCQMPRFSSGHGAIGMYAGTAGGPNCPVGI